MRAIRLILLFSLFLLLLSFVSAQEANFMALQGSVSPFASPGNILVEIWSAPTGGNLLYNSSSDFNSQLNSSGDFNIILGNGTVPLNLNYGSTYYMEMYVNAEELDFDGLERQVFYSSVGNLSVTTPIATSSSDADDAFNVSAGGVFVSGIANVGNITVRSTDADDAVNITSGGFSVFGGLQIANRFFNVSSVGNLITNGTIKIDNTDADGALNISTGGIFVAGQSIFTNQVIVNSTGVTAVNITGAVSYFRQDPLAINVTHGNVVIDDGGPSGTYKLNVRQGDARVGGTFWLTGSGTIFNATQGNVLISSTDADGALNISTGGIFVAGQSIFTNQVIVNSTGVTAVNITGAVSYFRQDPLAINVTHGNVVIDDGGPSGTYKLNVRQGDARVGGTFWLTGSGTIFNATQGNVLISSTDTDGALNISVGGAYINQDLTVDGFTTISQAFFGGTVKFDSNDPDDAVNVTQGGVAIIGDLRAGSSTLRTDLSKTTVIVSDILRMATRSTAPSSPVVGMIYVDSDTNELCFYNSTSWTGLDHAGACA